MSQLTIALFYVHEDAGTWTFHDLAAGRGVIAPDDLELATFAEAQGGLRILRDQVFCFLDTAAAGDVLSYVEFLLGTLAALTEDPALASLRPSDSLGVLLQLDGSRIVLRRGPDDLRLDHFDPAGEAPTGRLVPWFEDLAVAESVWVAAVVEALQEYFTVAESISRGAHPRLTELQELWLRATPNQS